MDRSTIYYQEAAAMHVFHHPRSPMDRAPMADRVIGTLIAAVVILNLILMWRIAIGGV